ncbi:glycoside hydrolase family 2 TIM barrel-domain containing protein [Robiginitalea marina]|uniref:Glycoside hydrolase family 2 catalytic domain-containing protein n=1 Tax=Robiginitalea marina TaxID=2954105 RepID=A0ABT1B095_9FLAO|nr:glycoside hydrolase family 2 TIM barrel-domain containing protein [Robiginitalea marina]MCO5725265.1 hypothetical protein [Robiginitalea marina]
MTRFIGVKKLLVGIWILLGLLSGMSCSDPGPEITSKKVFVAHTESGFQLFKDGVPFPVKGACVGDSFWEAFQEAGGNTLRIYDTTSLKHKLDKAASLGLMVAVEIPVPSYSPDEDTPGGPGGPDAINHGIAAVVKEHRNHPALLFWILGNEVNYPEYFKGKRYVRQFNDWISLIHELDPDHPVTTTLAGPSRRLILSLYHRSPGLDFLSINLFGHISTLRERLDSMSWLWDGPFMISEWGINGPWEAEVNTDWGAPVEQTSTKKAEQYLERFRLIQSWEEPRLLGNFIFYWGQKEERTPTWFSTHLPDGRATEIVSQFEGCLGGTPKTYTGPRINYMLLEAMGAGQSITLPPSQEVTASVSLSPPEPSGLLYEWEIRPENWYYKIRELQQPMPVIPTAFSQTSRDEVRFNTPLEEGPYRLYLYVGDTLGNVATTNIPFYILNPGDAE